MPQSGNSEILMLASLAMPLVDDSSRLANWLHDKALPLWLERSFGEHRGFSESLTSDGQPTSANQRSRIYPRQIYCFAEAGARGWTGDWERAVRSGLTRFDEVYRLGSGFYGALATVDGQLIDESFDLYNQAFAILGFCYTAKALPNIAEAMSDRAQALLDALKTHYAHPTAGFKATGGLPLCSNPHMHLFEAALACEDQMGFDRDTWAGLADELAGLCMSRFVDPETGALREFFDGDWRHAEGVKGRIIEPGHHFEWAWLLARWAQRRKRTDALSMAKRLFQIGVDHGICPDRRVAVMALLDDFSVHDPMARLWPQTEWLKAAVRLAVLSEGPERERYLASAQQAVKALDLFLDAPLEGLWRDKLRPDRTFVEEPAPTSSFYHILCAVYELQDSFSPTG
jgi:mannose-6-phosphate isomerase